MAIHVHHNMSINKKVARRFMEGKGKSGYTPAGFQPVRRSYCEENIKVKGWGDFTGFYMKTDNCILPLWMRLPSGRFITVGVLSFNTD